MVTFIPWRSWSDTLLTNGLSDSHNEELCRKVAIMNSCCIITVFVLLFMAITAFYHGNAVVAMADFCLALALGAILFYLRKTENLHNAALVALSFAGFFLLYLFISGGVKGTGHLWLIIFPLVSTSVLGSREGIFASSLLLGATLFFVILEPSFSFATSYTTVFKIRFFFAFTIVAAYTFLFERMRENSLVNIKDVNILLREKVGILEHTRQALQEKEATYREVVENASDGIIILQDSRIRFYNPRMADMLGYTVTDLYETVFTNYLHPDEKEKLIARYEARINGEEPKQSYETRLIHKKGHEVAVDLNAALISYNKKPAILIIVRDINQRKALELDQLKALQAAKSANQAKNAFVSNMSHELRTPLNQIIGFTDLVRSEACGTINDQQRDFLADVAHSSHHLLTLVNNILDLTRIEAGEMTVLKHRIAMADLTESLTIFIQQQEKSKKINLTITVAPDVPELIFVDVRKLKQVVSSVLDNALKFTPAGGTVHLTVSRTLRGDGIVTQSDMAVNWLEFCIEDSGIGIEEQDLQIIFSSFQQLDNDANRQFQGTGLGLALTRKLVELQGGYIDVKSSGKGSGSKFTIAIPLPEDVTLADLD